jgi:hypothetical protein
MTNQEFNTKLLKEIESIKGVSNVKEIFENPNKYGQIIGTIFFTCPNLRRGEVKITYSTNSYFIPDYGYRTIEEYKTDRILKDIKKAYKI